MPPNERAKFSSKSELSSSSENSDPPVLIAADNEIETESTPLPTTTRIGWLRLIFEIISRSEIHVITNYKSYEFLDFYSESSLPRTISPTTSSTKRKSLGSYQRFSSIQWAEINASRTEKLSRTECRNISKVCFFKRPLKTLICPFQEISRKWRNMSVKDKSKFNNKNETQTVSEKKKSVAGSRSESGLSEHGLGNVSVSMTSSSVSTTSSSVSSSFSSVSVSSSETESDSDTASSETSDSDSVVASNRLRTSATDSDPESDSDIESDSETDSDTDTDSVKGRKRASAKLCSKVSSEESLETSTSVESETESFEFEYTAEEVVPEDTNVDDVDEDTNEIAEEVQIEESSGKNSKSDKKKRKSAFEVFSGQEWNRINASRQEKPQREELIELSKVNISL